MHLSGHEKCIRKYKKSILNCRTFTPIHSILFRANNMTVNDALSESNLLLNFATPNLGTAYKNANLRKHL